MKGKEIGVKEKIIILLAEQYYKNSHLGICESVEKAKKTFNLMKNEYEKTNY